MIWTSNDVGKDRSLILLPLLASGLHRRHHLKFALTPGHLCRDNRPANAVINTYILASPILMNHDRHKKDGGTLIVQCFLALLLAFHMPSPFDNMTLLEYNSECIYTTLDQILSTTAHNNSTVIRHRDEMSTLSRFCNAKNFHTTFQDSAAIQWPQRYCLRTSHGRSNRLSMPIKLENLSQPCIVAAGAVMRDCLS
jgi:hypothetical protein